VGDRPADMNHASDGRVSVDLVFGGTYCFNSLLMNG
jgi:hypothetical protein